MIVNTRKKVLSKNGTCLIVDPGDDFIKIKEAIGEDKVLGVLITHSHVDHIGALRNFLTKRSIKIFKRSNLEEKEYTVGDFTFKCIHTPGHSPGSISFVPSVAGLIIASEVVKDFIT